jgi:hypothetical protein
MTALTIPNSFSPDTDANAPPVNANFIAIASVVNGNLDTTNLSAAAAIPGSQLSASAGITNAQLVNGASLAPYGSVVAWWAVDSTIPTGWALCNGQTTLWLTGPHAGASITLPNLIGMMIQGADITGGSSSANADGFGSQTNQSIFGTTTHTHTYSGTTSTESADSDTTTGGTLTVAAKNHTHTYSGTTAATSLQPPVYAMVYIMKL